MRQWVVSEIPLSNDTNILWEGFIIIDDVKLLHNNSQICQIRVWPKCVRLIELKVDSIIWKVYKDHLKIIKFH